MRRESRRRRHRRDIVGYSPGVSAGARTTTPARRPCARRFVERIFGDDVPALVTTHAHRE